MSIAPLYVLWDDELQEAFNRLARQEGGSSAAARRLGMADRRFFSYRVGESIGKGGSHPRKFLSLKVLEQLALALDELELENREALTHREWCDRGGRRWGPTDPRAEDGRFVPRTAA